MNEAVIDNNVYDFSSPKCTTNYKVMSNINIILSLLKQALYFKDILRYPKYSLIEVFELRTIMKIYFIIFQIYNNFNTIIRKEVKNMEEVKNGRIIIFTGKGGVGKTSVAAAHARKASLNGLKTLLVSTDMAHNLGDLFEVRLSKEPLSVTDKLDLLELDPIYEMEENYGHIMKAIMNLFPDTGGKKQAMEDIVIFPGIEELFCLLKIQDIYESGSYDVIIVDCAPTGETLSLLKMPELMSWYMEKFLPIEKVAIKILRPVTKRLFKLELPNTKAMNDIEKVYYRLCTLQKLLKNRNISSIRLVTIPEKMVVEETKRNYMYMNLYNFNVDGVFINRILPEEADNSFFIEWQEIQKKYINELINVFYEIPIYRIKWYGIDLNGINALDSIIEDSLSDDKLFDIHIKDEDEVYEQIENGYLLRLYLPGTDKDELLVHVSGTDLIIKIGNFKRSIPLPNVVKKLNVRAKMDGSYVNIYFEH